MSSRPAACRAGRCGTQSAGLELGESLQPALDPLGEFAGGLARERETEDLVATDEAVRDEPDDARGHRLGLAAAGARDDERRRERGLDHRGLLVRRRELTERGGDRRGESGLGGHGVVTTRSPPRSCGCGRDRTSARLDSAPRRAP